MNDRRRLLVFSILILVSVALAAVVITSWHYQAFARGNSQSSAVVSRDLQPLLLATCTTLVVVVAGGTLLVRASNPFMRRLEESESRIRTILNTAADGIITLDSAGRIETFNVAAEQLFECPPSIALGSSIFRFIASAQSIVPLRSISDLASSRDLLAVKPDGSRLQIEVSVSEMSLAERTSYTVIARDITERKAAEERVRQHVLALDEAHSRLEAKAAELARINQELDDFTYIASHDLKEPLRGISSYCQILLEDYADKLDDEGRRRLQALVALCQRLSQLIDDLLTYSQIGRTNQLEADVPLRAVVQSVLDTLGPSIENRKAAVRVEDDLPTVVGNATMLGEVFRNLITNALKFNESARPLVEIGCVPSDPATVYVRDNGIGIAPQHHAAIFTLFRRLHGRSKYEGTGAGLTFVRKIVETHGGRCWVESELGFGSTFYFTLQPANHDTPEQFAACAAG